MKLRRQKVERRPVCTIRRPSSLAQLAVAQCPVASPGIACRSRIGRTMNQVKSDKVNKGRVRPQTRQDGAKLDGGRELPPRVRRSGTRCGFRARRRTASGAKASRAARRQAEASPAAIGAGLSRGETVARIHLRHRPAALPAPPPGVVKVTATASHISGWNAAPSSSSGSTSLVNVPAMKPAGSKMFKCRDPQAARQYLRTDREHRDQAAPEQDLICRHQPHRFPDQTDTGILARTGVRLYG